MSSSSTTAELSVALLSSVLLLANSGPWLHTPSPYDKVHFPRFSGSVVIPVMPLPYRLPGVPHPRLLRSLTQPYLHLLLHSNHLPQDIDPVGIALLTLPYATSADATTTTNALVTGFVPTKVDKRGLGTTSALPALLWAPYGSGDPSIPPTGTQPIPHQHHALDLAHLLAFRLTSTDSINPQSIHPTSPSSQHLPKMTSTSSVLTAKQEEELRLSILDYLRSAGFTKSFEALSVESGLGEALDEAAGKKTAGLLEKKWTSVIRLQKKVMDLEQKVASLQDELATAVPSSRKPAANADWIPKGPARSTLAGHRSPITSVTFHPTFSILASASEDATIKMWDYEAGEFERTLKGHTKAVQFVAFDRAEKGAHLVASCSADLSIKLWDGQADYACIKTLLGHDHSVSSVHFVHPGDFIVSASRDKTIKIWEIATGFCTKTLFGHDDWVRMAVPSDDGKLIASCANDQTVRIWDFATGDCKHVLKGHEHVVECVAFAPMASVPSLRDLAGIDTKTKDQAGVGQYVASGSRDKLIKIWDTLSGECVFTLAGHDNWVRGLAFHPNGKFLFSVSDDKSIKVWDLKAGRCVRTLDNAHEHFVTAIDVHRGGQALIATGSVDQSVRLWNGVFPRIRVF
ncbi:WD40-repeat-containing domain protein [Zopfochytrium polystomum]|nr:WD40-repeat-containing domain protein [Zopfochytrium polystomum]